MATRNSVSLRATRLRAQAPRIVLGVLVTILAAAGVRAIVSRPHSTVRVVNAPAAGYDLGAGAFAEAFTAVYLSWGGADQKARDAQLKSYLPTGLDSDGGLQPASGSEQTVASTHVAAETTRPDETDVVVVANTSAGAQYLSVPVGRDRRGFMYLAGYPALVGAPATNPGATLPNYPQVTDPSVQSVVRRALGNYLSGQGQNLTADLTPDAVVSMPAQQLTLSSVDRMVWTTPGRTVAVEVQTTDHGGDRLTFTYQIGIVRRDRWYVQTIQFDPTLRGR